MCDQDFIPVNEPLLKGNEKKYLNECIDSGWISSEGPFVKTFEDKFSELVCRENGVAVSSGTAALDVAVEALGIGKGDEVIMPTFTIISCIGQIIRSGATPVLVDSDPITWNMDINQVEDKITTRTRAIMVVHIFGLPVDIDPIRKIAEKKGIYILEDAAEMIGQKYKGRPCGSFGDISTFSFYSNKHITTGEGGMILTNDKKLADKSRFLRNLCFQTHLRFVHESLGWNLRMTNMQAAIGLAQLEQLDEFVVRKRHMGKQYSELLSDISGIQLPLSKTDYAENIYWVYGIVLDKEIGFDAKEAIRRLAESGVGSRPFFYPMHQQPVFKKMGLFGDISFPVAEWLYQKGFYIPSGLALNEEKITTVAKLVKNVLA